MRAANFAAVLEALTEYIDDNELAELEDVLVET